MDFYENLLVQKAIRKLNYRQLGSYIGMGGEAFRMAVNRKSLSDLQIKEIEKNFEIENKEDYSKIESVPENESSGLKDKLLDYFMSENKRLILRNEILENKLAEFAKNNN